GISQRPCRERQRRIAGAFAPAAVFSLRTGEKRPGEFIGIRNGLARRAKFTKRICGPADRPADYFRPMAAIFLRRKAICVESGRFFGQTSWQASSVMQPNTPLSSPINW